MSEPDAVQARSRHLLGNLRGKLAVAHLVDPLPHLAARGELIIHLRADIDHVAIPVHRTNVYAGVHNLIPKGRRRALHRRPQPLARPRLRVRCRHKGAIVRRHRLLRGRFSSIDHRRRRPPAGVQAGQLGLDLGRHILKVGPRLVIQGTQQVITQPLGKVLQQLAQVRGKHRISLGQPVHILRKGHLLGSHSVQLGR